MALSTRAQGTLITLAGVLAFAPDALLVRLTAVDALTLTAGRGLLGGMVVLAGCAIVSRIGLWRELRGLGWPGLAVAVLQAFNLLLFLVSMQLTTAANALIVFSTAPLLTALLALVLLREPVSAATWCAILASMAGLGVVVSGSAGSGRIAGDLVALLNALTVALSYIVIRRQRAVSMVPAIGLGLVLAAVAAAPFAAFPAMTGMQWLWLALGGGVAMPLALALLALGPRYLPAPEVAMLSLLEVVLGPYLVWLVLGEHPGTRTIWGGSIVISALLIHSAVALVRSGRGRPP